ncbi:hypothetical protein SAMN05446037_1007177 [Anaerovirgula multivorans]|uniref:Uncharacterized protein n=1 Tax=Anaerovirgula multivorans TaxID=312168 RepID=A0A239DJ27_9FIRM|nr:DUF6033 family protein [Anaerovirgula multivorans]SNS31664.1 hypothetical protein SAMN05446037_1007177 [Anaerovirgula multivorans]
MSIGINTSYINCYSSSSIQQTTKASETEVKAQKSEEDYLKELKEKYPSLKFSTGYSNAKGPSGTGLGNVVLHPNLLKKMASDPEFASKVENNIKYIPQGEAWLKNMLGSNGRKLVASGCFVDENGNVSSWSVSSTTIGNPKEDERKEQLEILQEKLAEERLEMERMLAKRADLRKSEEMLQTDTIKANKITKLYQSNYTLTDFVLSNFNKLT